MGGTRTEKQIRAMKSAVHCQIVALAKAGVDRYEDHLCAKLS